ncbi:MAG: hypothetical protein JST12_14420 [Armatimonadetes bacterium]|nr:hypothetical protein [Armatimonadota bacterium]
MSEFLTPFSLEKPTDQSTEIYEPKPVLIYRGGYMEVGSAANRPIAEAFVRAPALRSALASAVDLIETLSGQDNQPDLSEFKRLLDETPIVY